jgi:hypothetical protein
MDDLSEDYPGQYITGPDHDTRDQEGLTYVNAYAVSRNWGGPEEGGWWWDSGEPLASIPCRTEQEVEEAKARLTAILGPRFDYGVEGRISRYSMLDGTDLSVVEEEEMAVSWPTERPHYE